MNRLASETRRLANIPEPDDEKLVSAEEPFGDESVHSISRTVQTDGKLAILPLFAARSNSKPIHSDVSVTEPPLTIGDLRRKMGLVEKAKPGRRKVSDDQITLFALDAI
jgi:hypothetical protein